MSKIVTIEIDAEGNSTLDLVGFQGRGCDKVAAEFGGADAVLKSEKKREYAIEPAQKQKVQVQKQ